jgi:hypothetical protein
MTTTDSGYPHEAAGLTRRWFRSKAPTPTAFPSVDRSPHRTITTRMPTPLPVACLDQRCKQLGGLGRSPKLKLGIGFMQLHPHSCPPHSDRPIRSAGPPSIDRWPPKRGPQEGKKDANRISKPMGYRGAPAKRSGGLLLVGSRVLSVG